VSSDAEPDPPARPGLITLSDRLGVAPSSILAGVLAVAAAAGAAWWALRAPDPPPVESILPAAGTVTVATPAPSTTAAPRLLVHIEGEVARPGVHELADGARVMDAVAAAGGLTDDADRERINLAARVSDGERLWLPAVGEAEPGVVASAGGGDRGPEGESDGGPIDINAADESDLEQLPGIGPALAAAIVGHRNDHGPFRSVDDLLDVSGIGPAKLEQLRDLVVS
jgi:competence protein ComEA